jgi:hypothetical protein
MVGLTNQEVKKIVNQYIGIFGGYLSNFSYRTHADFYPEYCDLEIDPNQYEGTTRQRFITILENSPPHAQAKIVRGVLQRFPLEDENKKPSSRTKELYDELLSIVQRLESTTPFLQNEQIINEEKEVFISYAWRGESEELVNRLYEAFQARGIKIIRDKTELGYKGLIKEFMQRIGRGKYVVIVISDRYLKSPNCMYELIQISQNGDFYNRTFPIVLADAQIYDPVQRLRYIKHWEDKKKELNEAIREVSAEYLQGIREEIDQYTQIRNTIAELTSILKNMNTLTADMHSESDFKVLFNALQSKLVDSPVGSNTCEPTIQKPASQTGDITLQQFIGNQLSSNEQLTFFIKQIGLANPRQDYTKAQFEAYCNIWKSLQALRLVGSELWDKASKDNLVKFANQLRDTTQLVYEDSIFFEESDYSQLKAVLEEFKYFHIGKKTLIRIRSIEDIKQQEKLLSPVKIKRIIAEQIERNRHHKIDYENILDRIRVSFNSKLSRVA